VCVCVWSVVSQRVRFLPPLLRRSTGPKLTDWSAATSPSTPTCPASSPWTLTRARSLRPSREAEEGGAAEPGGGEEVSYRIARPEDGVTVEVRREYDGGEQLFHRFILITHSVERDNEMLLSMSYELIRNQKRDMRMYIDDL